MDRLPSEIKARVLSHLTIADLHNSVKANLISKDILAAEIRCRQVKSLSHVWVDVDESSDIDEASECIYQWQHPLQVIYFLRSAPQLADRIESIRLSMLPEKQSKELAHKNCLSRPGVGSFGEGQDNLHEMSDISEIIDRIACWPTETKDKWRTAIKESAVLPSLFVLMLLCPKLRELRFDDFVYEDEYEATAADGLEDWMIDLVPFVNDPPTAYDANHKLQLHHIQIDRMIILPRPNSLGYRALLLQAFVHILIRLRPQEVRTQGIGGVSVTRNYLPAPAKWPDGSTTTLRRLNFDSSYMVINDLLMLIEHPPNLDFLAFRTDESDDDTQSAPPPFPVLSLLDELYRFGCELFERHSLRGRHVICATVKCDQHYTYKALDLIVFDRDYSPKS